MRRYALPLLFLTLTLALFSLLPATLQAQPIQCDLETAPAFTVRGDFAYDAGDYERAIADYTCALQIDDENLYAYTMRGNSHLILQQYVPAMDDYDSALALSPDTPWVLYFGRGSAYLGLKDYEQAEADLNQAIELSPGQGVSYTNRGNIYYEQGDYTRAIEDYDQAIELPDGDKYIPYYNRGLANYELGNYEVALEDFNQSLFANPDYSASHLARAGLYQIIDVTLSHAEFLRWIELNQIERIDSTSVTRLDDESITMAEGRVYPFSFTASTGQKLNAAARADSGLMLDPLIVLLDESGTPIASDDDSGVNLDAVIAGYEIPVEGTYTLLVSHAGGGFEGEILVTLALDGEASKVFSVYTLTIGQPARVYTTEGDRLNLRSGPGLNFEIVGKLERETEVTLLEGPRKADGLAWWRVRTSDGLEGWSVERVDEEQTLQPPLVNGSEATVYPLSGDKLNVRENAGRTNPIVTQLEQGVVVTILDGPQEADGFRWWKIRTTDGSEGWAVDEADGEQTLIGKAQAVGQ